MLNTVENSRAKKTAGLAVTYRAAGGDMYGTCPDTCPLKPAATDTTEIDRDYESAVFNHSADTLADAARHTKNGAASVAVVSADYWQGRDSAKVTEADGVTMVRCPNETTGIDCRNCGNGTPLCARSARAFGIVFTAHGVSKRKAGDNETAGGCYAGGGKVALHWRHLSERDEVTETDAEHVARFAASLAPRSILRHHIAGDIGAAPRAVK